MDLSEPRPVALVTGASRRDGLGAAIAIALATSGWDVATTYWSAFDAEMSHGDDPDGPGIIAEAVREAGGRTFALEADLSLPGEPERAFAAVTETLGPICGLVLNHCECRPTGLMETTLESLQAHFTVNVLANASLIHAFAHTFPDGGRGRIVALTSDHTVGNVPYGVTKGALDRLVLSAAYELASLGVTANTVNPGPTDTGWMSEAVIAEVAAKTPLPRAGIPGDVANLVAFLCSEAGGWVTGQLLYSNGGFRSTIG